MGKQNLLEDWNFPNILQWYIATSEIMIRYIWSKFFFFYWLNESKADLMFLSSSFVGVPEVCHEFLWKFLLSKMLILRKLTWYPLSFGQLIFHNIFHSVHFCLHKDTSFLFLSWRNVKGVLFSKVKESDKISPL